MNYSIDTLIKFLKDVWVNYDAYCLGDEDEKAKMIAVIKILEERGK